MKKDGYLGLVSLFRRSYITYFTMKYSLTKFYGIISSHILKFLNFFIEYMKIFNLGNIHRNLRSFEKNPPLSNVKLHSLTLKILEGRGKPIVEL